MIGTNVQIIDAYRVVKLRSRVTEEVRTGPHA